MKKIKSIPLPAQYDGKKKFMLTFTMEVRAQTVINADNEGAAWKKAEKLSEYDELEYDIDDIFDVIHIEPNEIEEVDN